MRCTNCGQECYYTQSPEIVFTDDKNVICEDCSIDFYEADDGTIVDCKMEWLLKEWEN